MMDKKPNPNAQALGKLGGSVCSEKKKKASAENGKKGGRPKKLQALTQPNNPK